jgi:hypothetical protein
MESHAPAGADAAMTVSSLREIVRKVSLELRLRGRVASASQLEAAADLKSSPADEVLAMREAMVQTRPDWSAVGVAVAPEATRAMNEAKDLAIRL